MPTPARLLPAFSLGLILLGVALPAFTGLGQTQAAPMPPVGAAPTENNPDTWSWEQLKAAEFEQREAFEAQLDAMHAAVKIDLEALRARFKQTDASESQKKAMTALDQADVDFTQKMLTLDNVTADTWETVKSNLLSAWLTLQEALKKTRPTE